MSQIEQAKSDIATLEEAEITLMYSIDEAREAFEASKGKLKSELMSKGKQSSNWKSAWRN